MMKLTNLKTWLISIGLLLLGTTSLFAQQNATKKKIIIEAFGVPLESTKQDTKGNIITNQQFSDSLYTTKYFFDRIKNDNKETITQLKIIDAKGIEHGIPQSIKETIDAFNFEPRPAIDFSVTDIKGKKYQLSKLKDKTVVLNFWFTNCPPCRKEIPELNELVKANPDVIFIAFAEDKLDKLKKFLAKNPFNYNIIPEASKVSKKYGVAAYPTHYVIKNGMFVQKFISGDSIKKIQDAINEK